LGGQNRYHVRHRSENAATGQTQTARASARRYSTQTLQYPHRAGLHRLARKAIGDALKISLICITFTSSAQYAMTGFTSATRRICDYDCDSAWKEIATLSRGPLKLIYYEAYLEQADALGRERYLKSGAGRRFLKVQLRHYLAGNPIRCLVPPPVKAQQQRGAAA